MNARAFAPLLLAFGSACVTGNYQHVSIDEPVRDEWLAALRPGSDSLTACLQRLGAPHRVFEYRVAPDLTSGMALLWFWRDEAGWGVRVSGGARGVSGSLSLDQLDTELPGCVLFFGPDLVLESWQRGRIGELLKGRRKRPAPVGDG